VVGPWGLAFDISSVAVSMAIPGIAWALLFALAWRHPGFAKSVGLGPRAFWLLLPGAILASFALLPIAPVSSDILAVSFAGAVFPLGIAVVALDRVVPPLRRWAARLFVPLIAETVVLLGVVVLADDGLLARIRPALGTSSWGVELGLVVLFAAVATTLVAALSARRSDANGRAVAGIFALTSAVLVLTFAGARAIPGVGIAEPFPYFLLPPILVGVVAALLAGRWFPGEEGFALPVAFFAAGWGVILGADVLWQPPLYGTGPAGLYVVGGAGALDLVYLSGFLGLLGAWGLHVLLGRPMTPVGAPISLPPPIPSRRLREAFALASDGSTHPSVSASAAAATASALQAHRLLGSAPRDPSRPWVGLAVPGWVVSDHANLESLARAGTSDPRESWRAYATARALVRLGEALGSSRFATIGQRLAAFAIDAGLLGVAASAIFAGIVLVTPGGLDAVLGSVAFNAAVYGLVGVALVYFAVAEVWFGATVGKALLGIEVKDRSLEAVGGVASFVRNAPLLPVMTLYSIGLALSIAIAMDGFPSNATLAGIGLPAGTLAIVSLGLFVLAGIGLAGAVGIAAIALSGERQRVGDLWAGTWVVRRLRGPGVPSSPPAPVARSA
jgi:uncharacterized RDD family membrane protein YckC